MLLTKTDTLLLGNYLPDFLNDQFGFLLVILGALGRFYSMLFIGGKKDRKIVTDGPFSVVRNPLYVCSFIALIGFLLMLGRIDVAIVVLPLFMFYYKDTVAREEANLEAEFGKEYMDYKKKTPKYIPNFKIWKAPEYIEVKTSVMRKYFIFLLCFVIAIPLLQWLEKFKETYREFGLIDLDKLLGL